MQQSSQALIWRQFLLLTVPSPGTNTTYYNSPTSWDNLSLNLILPVIVPVMLNHPIRCLGKIDGLIAISVPLFKLLLHSQKYSLAPSSNTRNANSICLLWIVRFCNRILCKRLITLAGRHRVISKAPMS